MFMSLSMSMSMCVAMILSMCMSTPCVQGLIHRVVRGLQKYCKLQEGGRGYHDIVCLHICKIFCIFYINLYNHTHSSLHSYMCRYLYIYIWSWTFVNWQIYHIHLKVNMCMSTPCSNRHSTLCIYTHIYEHIQICVDVCIFTLKGEHVYLHS